jgi:hypothetical protein
MKKHFLIVCVITGFFLCFVTYLISQKNDANHKDAVRKELTKVSNTDNDMVYKAFYSLEELRPFSIIQIDKISEIYQNDWISPADIVGKLTAEDKLFLMDRIVDMIENTPSEFSREKLMQKINDWCNSYYQIKYLNNRMEFSMEELVSACSGIDEIKDFVESLKEKRSFDKNWLNKINKDKAFFAVVNYVSNMNKKSQCQFYSKLYGQLAANL